LHASTKSKEYTFNDAKDYFKRKFVSFIKVEIDVGTATAGFGYCPMAILVPGSLPWGPLTLANWHNCTLMWLKSISLEQSIKPRQIVLSGLGNNFKSCYANRLDRTHL